MKITNWNGRPVVRNARLTSFKKGEVQAHNFCPRGNGKSYGDASLQEELISMVDHREILQLNESILEASCGFTIGELLNFVVPKGYILPVIPGTQHATLGGAIAADIHGKNHSENGTIGAWIEHLEIQKTDGSIVQCSAHQNTKLFKATIGGLGLTGIIISAKIKLNTLLNDIFNQKVSNYESVHSLLDALWKSPAPFKTGWFDFFQQDRCLLIENTPQKTQQDLTRFELKKQKISVPFKSFAFVRPAIIRHYNKRYFRKTLQQNTSVPLNAVMFPLDSIKNWNYLYGKKGFYQVQWSFSVSDIESKLNRVLDAIHQSKFQPVLCVVKKHGSQESPGILSFPKEGFSFAFDFVYKSGLETFIAKLYDIITEEHGRVYLVKDAILTAANFEKMYPEAEMFKEQISEFNDGSIASILSKRLNLTQ